MSGLRHIEMSGLAKCWSRNDFGTRHDESDGTGTARVDAAHRGAAHDAADGRRAAWADCSPRGAPLRRLQGAFYSDKASTFRVNAKDPKAGDVYVEWAGTHFVVQAPFVEGNTRHIPTILKVDDRGVRAVKLADVNGPTPAGRGGSWVAPGRLVWNGQALFLTGMSTSDEPSPSMPGRPFHLYRVLPNGAVSVRNCPWMLAE
jgi:hypothetical protein